MRRFTLLVLVALTAACADETDKLGIAGPDFNHSTGVLLCCHDQWTAQGTFTRVDAAPDAVFAGLGSDALWWGIGNDPSTAQLLEFTTTTTSSGIFPTSGVLISFSHRNGVIFGGAISGGEFAISLTACDFDVAGCTSSEPPLEVQRVAFQVVSTPNTTDPIASADGLLFPDLPKNIWVLEGETASFDIIYQRRSPIEIIDIRSTSPGGFVSVGASPDPVLQLEVDLKPGSDRNPVNPGANGVIPVAFLGSLDLAIEELDAETIRMGAGDAVSRTSSREDVDADGLDDLILHFPTRETGIVCGDDLVTFSGATVSGDHVSALATIETVGCRE